MVRFEYALKSSIPVIKVLNYFARITGADRFEYETLRGETCCYGYSASLQKGNLKLYALYPHAGIFNEKDNDLINGQLKTASVSLDIYQAGRQFNEPQVRRTLEAVVAAVAASAANEKNGKNDKANGRKKAGKK